MGKKKHSKKQRRHLRKELQKAQGKAFRGYTEDMSFDTVKGAENGSERSERPENIVNEAKTTVSSRSDRDFHRLPVDQIRKDLIKIILFAIFSVAFLIFLDVGNIDLQAIRGFLRF